MTFKEHHGAVSAAAKDVYEAVEKANNHGIIIYAGVYARHEVGGSVFYLPEVSAELLAKGREDMTDEEKVLRRKVSGAMASLASRLTNAAEDGYAFAIKRVSGGMFMVIPAESSIEV